MENHRVPNISALPKRPLPNNELHAALHLFITYWERRLRPRSESGIERSQSGTFPVLGDGYRAGACIVELRAHSNSIRTTFRLPSRTRTQSPFKLNHQKKPPGKIDCTGGRGVNQVDKNCPPWQRQIPIALSGAPFGQGRIFFGVVLPRSRLSQSSERRI